MTINYENGVNIKYIITPSFIFYRFQNESVGNFLGCHLIELEGGTGGM